MLKKGERICPVCGKKLLLRAPSNRDADEKDIRSGYPCGAVRTQWSIMPYTIYPHREHRIVRTRTGPYYISANSIDRKLRSDGLSLFNPFLVFFCEECSSRLSLNFNPGVLLETFLVMLTFDAPLLITGCIFPPLFIAWWAIALLALLGSLFLAWSACMAYVKLFLSNFVPVDEYDALRTPTTELSLSPEGLKKRFLHESNVFTVQLSQQTFQLYLAKKTDSTLAFSVCGVDGEPKRFVTLLEQSGEKSLNFMFEGKSVGSASVKYVFRPECGEE